MHFKFVYKENGVTEASVCVPRGTSNVSSFSLRRVHRPISSVSTSLNIFVSLVWVYILFHFFILEHVKVAFCEICFLHDHWIILHTEYLCIYTISYFCFTFFTEYVSERVIASGRPSGTAITSTVTPTMIKLTKYAISDGLNGSCFIA